MTESAKKKKVVQMSAKRKTAFAKAVIKEGKGLIRIDGVLLANCPEALKMRIEESLALVKDYFNRDNFNIYITVRGGGVMGQADAARTALSRALIKASDKPDAVKAILVKYDRTLIAGDSRRTEPHKPSRSSQGARAKRQKSYR